MSKLVHIQLLRALAALSVAFLHAQHDAAGLSARLGFVFAPLDQWPWMAGVDVFFVISGFIMVYTSRDLFGAPGAPGIFLARRIARIVPLYWGVTTLYVAVALLAPMLVNGGVQGFWPVVASYLFIPFERSSGPIQPIYSLGWTLNYEMFFYVLFALVLVWRQRLALLVLIAALSALTIVGRTTTLPQPLAFWTDPIILEFAFGVMLGILRVSGRTLPFVVRVALAILAFALLGANIVGTSSDPMLRPLGWGVPAALLVAAAALGPERPAALDRLTRFGVRVGDVSYAIYLIHPFVIRSLSEVIARSGLGWVLGASGFFAITLLGTLIASFAVHLWFERPLTSWLRRKLEPVRQPGLSSP